MAEPIFCWFCGKDEFQTDHLIRSNPQTVAVNRTLKTDEDVILEIHLQIDVPAYICAGCVKKAQAIVDAEKRGRDAKTSNGIPRLRTA